MKCIISHPNIAPYIKESVLAYQEKGLLHKFFTTYFQHSKYPFTQKLIRLFPWFEKEFKRRNIEEINYEYLQGNPFHEMIRIISARLNISWVENRVWQWNERKFDRWVANHLTSELQWVHTYEHAALATIRRAKQLGVLSFYEQPSQHHLYLSKIIEEQLSKYPELSGVATDLMKDKHAIACDARKDLELLECDYIICNSTFTLNTLMQAGIKEKKIIKIPLGFPTTSKVMVQKAQSKKMVFLYAGNQNLRKGTHILYQAWADCNFDPDKAELLLIGETQLPDYCRASLPSTIKFMKNMPREELLTYYEKANVFVLPTLADGFGMVISEAMAKGLPVIATNNSGGPDIITHGKNGLLVDANDVEALSEVLKWCYKNPKSLSEIGENAFQTAKSYPWSAYREKLISEVSTRVNAQQKSLSKVD